jgi:hypothetical protein
MRLYAMIKCVSNNSSLRVPEPANYFACIAVLRMLYERADALL